MMFATLQELRDGLRGFRESLEGWLVNSLANAFLRTTIASVSTEDSGEQLLVDRVNVYAASEEGQEQSSTEVGRLEMAGHLVIPRLNEPAQVLGDPRNAAYLPLASGKYRPSGGQPGDSAVYNLTDEASQRATAWMRESGQVTIDSGVAAGKDVQLNGGTLEVARRTDPCRIIAPVPGSFGFLGLWMEQVETAINALAPGSVAPLSSTFLDIPGIVIKDGAPHVKA